MYMYLISDAVKTMHSNKYMYKITELQKNVKNLNYGIFSTQQ